MCRKPKTYVAKNRALLGNTKSGQFTQCEMKLLEKNGFLVSGICSFYSQLYIIEKNRIINSSSTSRALKRDNSCVAFTDNDTTSEYSYGLLQKLIKVDTQCVAIVLQLRKTSFNFCDNDKKNDKFQKHFIAFHLPRLI